MAPTHAAAPSSTSTTTTSLLSSPPPPPIVRSSTLPINVHRNFATARSLLAPEDAIYHGSSPPRNKQFNAGLRMMGNGEGEKRGMSTGGSRGRQRKHGSRSQSRRRKSKWRKLLWVKQSYPDNYTDQETFLEQLQRNPRLQPYDFWPLVADSTVIVQHVCSVIIFVVCFVGIFQERISPVSVVGWGSILTILGFVLWDWWLGQESGGNGNGNTTVKAEHTHTPPISASSNENVTVSAASSTSNLAISSNLNNSSTSMVTNSDHRSPPAGLTPRHSHSTSASSIHSTTSNPPQTPRTSSFPPMNTSPLISHRNTHRLNTAKSALLIYSTLLGLSPILKSLTRSTSSDSIWAMSFLLFTINIFFFDYSSAPKNMPASLSTNAALMASTVLASRLPSTGQVFSLMLFSIEVFGLFPVFRKYARQRSWRGHVILTFLLVLGAGGGVGLTLGHGGGNCSSSGGGSSVGECEVPWKSGLLGAFLGALVAALAMGGCSWWLIGLQKYKNEIHGPWDPARPVIRRQWDYA
ncbi:phosphatidylinositol N-acetylglucosaminyltransferase-domain-containing protein [Xylogone sp. PMI_703]|nr:phosphatidylinositol N-acetylglucosaminyltransferase-domain-containing protein [Xylogone sp. PMI_703]